MTMRSRDVDRLVSNVMIEVGHGVSELGIKSAMYDVIKEFFDLSNAWFQWIGINLQPNVMSYAVYPTSGMFTRLVCVLDTNQVIIPAGISFGTQSSDSPAGSPPALYVDPPGVILSLVWPQTTGQTAQALLIKNIISPTEPGGIPDCPAWLLPLYEIAIREGLIGYLQMTPGKPYSNMAGAKYHLMRFRDQAMMAKVAVQRSNLLGGQSWRFPSQYRVNSQRGGVSTPFPTPTSWGV
jgi:hypothetical protein